VQTGRHTIGADLSSEESVCCVVPKMNDRGLAWAKSLKKNNLPGDLAQLQVDVLRITNARASRTYRLAMGRVECFSAGICLSPTSIQEPAVVRGISQQSGLGAFHQ
jgi:hypothetical protein